METDPDLEFEHYLTERLGWGSVERLRRGMSQAEYVRWQVYYARKAQRQELAQAQAGG